MGEASGGPYRTTYTRPVDIKKLAFIHRHLTSAGARSVLELGCGRGAIAMSLTGYDVTAVEIDPIERSHAAELGIDARPGDARTWTDGRVYDAVVASEVIEHVPDPERLITNAARHLNPGGLLVLTTPNGFGPYEMRHRHLNPSARLRRWNTLRRVMHREPYVAGGLDHARFFTMPRLLSIVEQGGFRLIERQNSDVFTGRDVALADRVPYWLASGWYFAMRRT